MPHGRPRWTRYKTATGSRACRELLEGSQLQLPSSSLLAAALPDAPDGEQQGQGENAGKHEVKRESSRRVVRVARVRVRPGRLN